MCRAMLSLWRNETINASEKWELAQAISNVSFLYLELLDYGLLLS